MAQLFNNQMVSGQRSVGAEKSMVTSGERTKEPPKACPHPLLPTLMNRLSLTHCPLTHSASPLQVRSFPTVSLQIRTIINTDNFIEAIVDLRI